MQEHTVKLAVYDLSRGMARSFGPLLGLHDLDSIPHSGLIVYEEEHFFGGGIQRMRHEQVQREFGLQPQKVEVLGKTRKTREEFMGFLSSISHRFTQQTYDLFQNNCNTFTDTCARFLLGVGIPDEISSLPSRVLNTPMGGVIAQMWNRMQTEMGSHMIPFSNPSVTAATTTVTTTTSASTMRTVSGSEGPPKPLLEALKSLEGECKTDLAFIATSRVILRILENISNNPNEPKYRQIKASNDVFYSSVGQYKSAIDVLLSLNFQLESGVLLTIYPTENNWTKLQLGMKIIMSARKKRIEDVLKRQNPSERRKEELLSLSSLDGTDKQVMEALNALYPE